MTGQAFNFDSELSIMDKLKSAALVASENSYQLIDYLDLFRASIINLIEDGHIFDDYMECRFLIEDPYMPDRSEKEWMEIIRIKGGFTATETLPIKSCPNSSENQYPRGVTFIE